MAKNQQQQNNIKEQIFETVTTIVDESVKDLGYNITKICEVTNVDEAEQFKYKVKCGLLEMNVVDDNKTDPKYSMGDIVRVTIPNGNYNAKKVIEGLYSVGSKGKIIYVEPKNHFIPMSKTYSIENDNKIAVTLNSINTNAVKPLCSFNFTNLDTNDAIYFNALYIKIASLFDKQYISGSYTLEIKTITNNNESETYKIHSSQLIGDPYSNLGFSQDFLIKDIDLKDLRQIVINFIQEDIYYQTSKEQSEKKSSEGKLNFQTIEVELGHVYEEKDNQSGLQLFTFDDLNYNFKPNDLEKNLKYIWYNIDTNKNFKGLSIFHKDNLYVPKNLNDEALTQTYLNIIQTDTKEELPRDEEGLRLVANYNVANQLVNQCIECLQNLAMEFQNFSKAFQTELFDYAYNVQYDSYSNIKTKKIHYWYNVLNPIYSALMGYSWTLQWDTPILKQLRNHKYLGAPGIHSVDLYVPRVYKASQDLITRKTINKNYDFYLYNDVTYPDGNSVIDFPQRPESYPGQLTNRYDYQENEKSISADNIIRAIESYLKIVKKFLIVKHINTDRINWDTVTEANLDAMLQLAGISDIDVYWNQTEGEIEGRKNYNYIVNLLKDWKSIAFQEEDTWPWSCLHNKRVVLYEDILNWLTVYHSKIIDRNESPFILFAEQLKNYHNTCEKMIKNSVLIQKKQSVNKLDLTEINFPSIVDINNFYGLSATEKITNNSNIKELIELFQEMGAFLARDFEFSPHLGQADASMMKFYNNYLRPIVVHMEELLNLLQKLEKCNYSQKNDILHNALSKYYQASEKGDINEKWSLKLGGGEGTFSIYLLEYDENATEKNLITNEVGWKICYLVPNDLEATMKMLLPTSQVKDGYYFSTKCDNDLIINLENFQMKSEKQYKLILKIYNKEDEMAKLIESNILQFQNKVNLNILTSSQYIKLFKNFNSGNEQEALCWDVKNSSIEFNIQCFDKDNPKQQIYPYSFSDLRYPKLEFFSYGVFQNAGTITDKIINFQEKMNSNGEINGIFCTWSSERFKAVGEQQYWYFVIGLRLWFNDNDSTEIYIPIPYANRKSLQLSGGTKTLVYTNNQVYFDAEDSYSLINLSTSTQNLKINSEHYELLFLDKYSLNEVQLLFPPIAIDEQNKLIVNDSNYTALSNYLPVLKATIEYLWPGGSILLCEFFQPILYFNKEHFLSDYEDNFSISQIIKETKDNIYTTEVNAKTGNIDLSCAYLTTSSNNFDKSSSLSTYARRNTNNQAALNSSIGLDYAGWARLSQTFPFFSFYNNGLEGKFQLDPSNKAPLEIMKDGNGIAFYYDGTIQLSKKNAEPIFVSYDTLTDGTLGIQIQSIGVIQDDEIISTCN